MKVKNCKKKYQYLQRWVQIEHWRGEYTKTEQSTDQRLLVKQVALEAKHFEKLFPMIPFN